jgi:hypothetical protein
MKSVANYRNGQQRYLATFISDTHPERTEAIVKSTHQTYKILIYNFYLVPLHSKKLKNYPAYSILNTTTMKFPSMLSNLTFLWFSCQGQNSEAIKTIDAKPLQKNSNKPNQQILDANS